jgi:RHS repeat-associated protein
MLAMRRKTDAGDVLMFPHGDRTANRVFTDAAGHVIQRVEYRPYGEMTEDTGEAGSALYSKYLWNGGETFKPFGLTLLGARPYDPASGRFLQRDPLILPRGASLSNPYMFAFGDPINFTDPTGLQACIGVECGPGPGPVAPPIEDIQPQSYVFGIRSRIEAQGGPTEFEEKVLASGYEVREEEAQRQRRGAPWRTIYNLKYKQWVDQGTGRILGYTDIYATSNPKTYDRYGNFLGSDEPGLETGFWYDPIDFLAGSGFARRAVTGFVSREAVKSVEREAVEFAEREAVEFVGQRIPTSTVSQQLIPRHRLVTRYITVPPKGRGITRAIRQWGRGVAARGGYTGPIDIGHILEHVFTQPGQRVLVRPLERSVNRAEGALIRMAAAARRLWNAAHPQGPQLPVR